MTALAFALRALPRDLRRREMQILAAAVAVAVAAVTAVGFFSDRVDRAMVHRATALLGADLVIARDDPLGDRWRQRAAALGLRTTGYVSFPSVVVTRGRTELVQVKAVEAGYPLRGEARTAARPHGEAVAAASVPGRGTVWLGPRLFVRLGIDVGDRIPLGARSFEVAAVLAHEPDRGGALFRVGPRLMMNRADLAGTGLLSAASRADYNLLVAGPPAAVARYRGWAAAQGGRGVEIRGIEDARPEMRAALERARAFLGLAAMLAVVLAGAAVAVAAHAFAAREADTSALLRCFGARQRTVVAALVLRLGATALMAALAGTAIGWLAQAGLVALVGAWFGDALPGPSAWPLVTGIGVALVTLIGFGLVPVLRIRRLPVVRVLQRGLGPPEPAAWAVLALATVTVAALVLHQAGDPELGGWVAAGTLAILAALAAAAAALVRVAGRLRGRSVGGWRFGLANLARRPGASVVQVVGFGLGLLALLLLAIVRVDVLAAWEDELPADAPNRFMINIQPAELDAIRARLHAAGIDPTGFHPMVRGRLVAIDGEPVEPSDYEPGRARELVEREFNLSWARHPRPGNEIVAGEWRRPHTVGELAPLSVEQGVADKLGIGLGDHMRFRVAGEPFAGTVTSIRRVDWDSFHVNFFVVTRPGPLDDAPATWITSYHAPPRAAKAIASLVRDFPGVTVIDVDQILDQVRAIIDQGARAVEYVFGFALLAGIVVLVAAVQASRDERRAEIALLRTLGASRRRVRAILGTEFAALGALAGLIAAAGAAGTGWVVTDRVLELPYTFNPWLFVVGVVTGAAGIGAAGLVATAPLLRERPLVLLRVP